MMKKIISFIMMMILMTFTISVFANETQKPFSERIKATLEEQKQTPLQRKMAMEAQREKLAKMPKVAVMYINNSQTTYNDEIDQLLLSNLTKSINTETYQYIDGTPYIERLSKIGIVDITTAERADIIDAFEGEDIDYAVFLQIDPFIRKDKMTFFTVGKEMTAIVPFKIIDVKNNRYLYNGKFTEIAKDSSMLGDIGNKSVAIKAVEKVNDKVASVIDVRLPKEKVEATKPAA